MARRGQGDHAGLSRESVLDAAFAVADRDGLEALSMRRVAAELGVEAMTLYHYLPSKAAMLDGIVERLFSLSSASFDANIPWQQSLTRYAFELRSLLLAHPQVAPLALTRPAATPETLALVENALERLVGEGFELGRAVDLLNVLTVLVVAHTISEIATTPVNDEAGPGSETALATLAAERYPLLVRAATEQLGTDDEQRLRFAIAALLDGYEATGTDSRT